VFVTIKASFEIICMAVEMASLWRMSASLQREIQWQEYYSKNQRRIIEENYIRYTEQICVRNRTEYEDDEKAVAYNSPSELTKELRKGFRNSVNSWGKLARVIKSYRIM